MFAKILSKLWQDDAGAVLTTEYLMLGTLVTLGGASGMAAMSDSINSEMREYGNAVRQMRQSYSVRGTSSGVASKAGSAFMDRGGNVGAAGCIGGQCGDMMAP